MASEIAPTDFDTLDKVLREQNQRFAPAVGKFAIAATVVMGTFGGLVGAAAGQESGNMLVDTGIGAAAGIVFGGLATLQHYLLGRRDLKINARAVAQARKNQTPQQL